MRITTKGFWPFLVGTLFYLTSVGTFFIAQDIYGNWLLSTGLTILWVFLYLVIGSRLLARLLMPMHVWKLLARRFPRTRKATEKNADSLGAGTLNDVELHFAVVVDKTALTVGVCQNPFLWRKVITIPWDQVKISRVGTNHRGNYVALISFPSIHGCELILPWRRKFAKTLDQVEMRISPTSPASDQRRSSNSTSLKGSSS